MKRFLTDLFLVFLGIAVIGLFGCAEPTAPDAEVVKDCMTSSGQWYNCETPNDTLPGCRPEVGCFPNLPPLPEE